MEPSPGADPGLLHYKSRVAAVRDGMEPSSGADPDHLPYEGKVTAVCDGLAGEPGLEPGLSWARTRRVAGLHHSPSLVPAQPARLAVRILGQLAHTMSHFSISASSRPDTPIGSRGRFPSGLDDPAMSTGAGAEPAWASGPAAFEAAVYTVPPRPRGAPPEDRTRNLQGKSLLLCQLS
jgi:hypothetical protein